MKRAHVASLVGAVMLLATGSALAQGPFVTEASPVRVEWESRTTRGSNVVISGYVYNTREMRLENVRLRVDTVDAASRPVSTRTAYVTGTVPSRDRAYFEVSVPSGGAAYRVTIESFDWAGCGNG
jgi:hypothetical protein